MSSLLDSAIATQARLTPIMGSQGAMHTMTAFYGAWSFGFNTLAGSYISDVERVAKLAPAARTKEFTMAARILTTDLGVWVAQCLCLTFDPVAVSEALQPHLMVAEARALEGLEHLAGQMEVARADEEGVTKH